MAISIGSSVKRHDSASLYSLVAQWKRFRPLAVVLLISVSTLSLLQHFAAAAFYAAQGNRANFLGDRYLICFGLCAALSVLLVFRARMDVPDKQPLLLLVSSTMLVFGGILLETVLVFLYQVLRRALRS